MRTLHRVCMVVSTDVPEGAARDVDVELAEVLGAAEDKLEYLGGSVLFCSTAEGYSGEFADLGADPTSWADLRDDPDAHDETTCDLCTRRARGETCSPTCAGWYIDDDRGAVQRCDACGLFDRDEAGHVVEEILRAAGHDATTDGWALFWADGQRPEIERDDEAGIFSHDDDAWPVAIAKLQGLTGCKVGPRP